MPKIVIIGNSAAGFFACETFTNHPLGNELTVLSEEAYPAYKRPLLLEYINGSVQEKDLFFCAEDFYKMHNVQLCKEATAARVDTKKQRIILKDNLKIEYDWLIIASGRNIEIPDIPGRTKEGVCVLYSLDDAKEIKERLAISHTVCLIGDAGQCLALSQVVSTKGKEVKIISKDKPDTFTSTEKNEWIDTCDVVELIGEGSELRALKLSSGKVIGTSLVLFTGGMMPRSDFLKDTGISMHSGYIEVDEGMRTIRENVFACGSVCTKAGLLANGKSWDEAATEGKLAAQSILNSIERGNTPCQQTS